MFGPFCRIVDDFETAVRIHANRRQELGQGLVDLFRLGLHRFLAGPDLRMVSEEFGQCLLKSQGTGRRRDANQDNGEADGDDSRMPPAPNGPGEG